MYSITKSFKFEAAHRLFNMPNNHPCRSIHGHSYIVIVSIFANELNSDMVIDFGKLKSFQNYLDQNFDHSIILNSQDQDLLKFAKKQNFKFYLIKDHDPTAEVMTKLFFEEIDQFCLDWTISPTKISITVQETVGNSATYEY